MSFDIDWENTALLQLDLDNVGTFDLDKSVKEMQEIFRRLRKGLTEVKIPKYRWHLFGKNSENISQDLISHLKTFIHHLKTRTEGLQKVERANNREEESVLGRIEKLYKLLNRQVVYLEQKRWTVSHREELRVCLDALDKLLATVTKTIDKEVGDKVTLHKQGLPLFGRIWSTTDNLLISHMSKLLEGEKHREEADDDCYKTCMEHIRAWNLEELKNSIESFSETTNEVLNTRAAVAAGIEQIQLHVLEVGEAVLAVLGEFDGYHVWRPDQEAFAQQLKELEQTLASEREKLQQAVMDIRTIEGKESQDRTRMEKSVLAFVRALRNKQRALRKNFMRKHEKIFQEPKEALLFIWDNLATMKPQIIRRFDLLHEAMSKHKGGGPKNPKEVYFTGMDAFYHFYRILHELLRDRRKPQDREGTTLRMVSLILQLDSLLYRFQDIGEWNQPSIFLECREKLEAYLKKAGNFTIQQVGTGGTPERCGVSCTSEFGGMRNSIFQVLSPCLTCECFHTRCEERARVWCR